ncbi:curli production assembly/transport protein CsgE, partial [Klebsiella pneumoniae subsp. pneumoniae]
KSAQIREILISESAWEEMTCLFAPSKAIDGLIVVYNGYGNKYEDE